MPHKNTYQKLVRPVTRTCKKEVWESYRITSFSGCYIPLLDPTRLGTDDTPFPLCQHAVMELSTLNLLASHKPKEEQVGDPLAIRHIMVCCTLTLVNIKQIQWYWLTVAQMHLKLAQGKTLIPDISNQLLLAFLNRMAVICRYFIWAPSLLFGPCRLSEFTLAGPHI